MYVTAGYELREFTAAPDCLDRAELTAGEFVARYDGDKALMRELISAAERALRSARGSAVPRP